MTQERIVPLRGRILEAMRIHGMGDKARKAHIRGNQGSRGLSKEVAGHGHTE